MWLMSKQGQLTLSDTELVGVIDRLTSFFVRRNLTGLPQTYMLPKLFMTMIDDAVGKTDLRTDSFEASHDVAGRIVSDDHEPDSGSRAARLVQVSVH